MKCQLQFSGKNISECHLLKFLPSKLRLNNDIFATIVPRLLHIEMFELIENSLIIIVACLN